MFLIFSTRCFPHQGSISPTFHVQLLCLQIPKAQKDSQLKQLFALLGSAGIKAVCNNVDEIDHWSQYVIHPGSLRLSLTSEVSRISFSSWLTKTKGSSNGLEASSLVKSTAMHSILSKMPGSFSSS